MKVKIYILLVVSFFAREIFSQNLLYPEEYFFEQVKITATKVKNIQADSVKDVSRCGLYSPSHASIFPNASNNTDDFTGSNFYKQGKSKIYSKFFRDHLINLSKTDTVAGEPLDFRVTVDPVFNFTFGKSNDSIGNTCYTNSRGITGKVSLNGNLQFETSFVENQSVFMSYVADNVLSTKDVLGQGRWKKFKTNGYDYAMSSGVLWWQPVNWLGFYVGHGKQKIGNGYRSLFLSDQAFNYPYARFDIDFKRAHIKYISTYALLTNLTATANVNPVPYTPKGTEPLLQRKPFSFQYLSWNPHWRFRLGMFQGMVWQPTDSQNKMNLSANYFNPLIFANTAVYGFDSYVKILTGLDAEVMFTRNISLYGQFALDGKKQNSAKSGIGLQTGLKLYNAFTIKNLFLQGEINVCNNQLYQNNSSTSIAGYTQYNRLLSLPLAYDNNKELSGIMTYRFKRLLLYGKGNYLKANNISGNLADVLSMEGRLAFIVNPSYNVNIGVGTILRHANYTSSSGNTNSQMNQLIYFSFKTSLYNVYLDL